jgi:hypothetical protein
MLLMKGWLETRWRLTALCVYLSICLALGYKSQNPNPKGLLVNLWLMLSFFVVPLAGAGVKSQSPAGFPEGLAGSTQFTLSLPVSRRRLLAVRASLGIAEATAVAVIFACLTWMVAPPVRASIAPADFVRAVLATLVFLTGPYCANLFFITFIDEPLSFMYSGWSYLLLLWLLHRAGPAVDIIGAFLQESPLITHRFPWTQMAVCAFISAILLWASVRMVETREY